MMPKQFQSALIFVFLFLCSVVIYAEVTLFTVIGQVTGAERLGVGSGEQLKPARAESTKGYDQCGEQVPGCIC